MNILIIRLSSFGDIVQAMAVNKKIKQKYPEATIHWLTKPAFAKVVALDPLSDKVISVQKSYISQFKSLLKQNQYDYVYDAHQSIRSKLMRLASLFGKEKWIIRPKGRLKRWLLFSWRKNLFPDPFIGRMSYISPLKEIGISGGYEKTSWNFVDETNYTDSIVFAPSAAWEMKRWPIKYWKELIQQVIQTGKQVILLGGPSDTFIEELVLDSNLVINLAGKTSLIESCDIVAKARFVVSADTGIIHVADALGVSGVLLNGPTAFGKTHGPQIKILESNLACMPCSKDGRGNCSQEVYQQCMVDLTPEKVFSVLKPFIEHP